MLTKDDLAKMRKIIREEVETEGEDVRSDIQSEIKLAGMRTTQELKEVGSKIKDLEIATRKLQKDLKITTNFLDKENLKTIQRVELIEEQINLPQP